MLVHTPEERSCENGWHRREHQFVEFFPLFMVATVHFLQVFLRKMYFLTLPAGLMFEKQKTDGPLTRVERKRVKPPSKKPRTTYGGHAGWTTKGRKPGPPRRGVFCRAGSRNGSFRVHEEHKCVSLNSSVGLHGG